eukprot:CAMPEP_0174302010 /NCGR_PEP_ID=MMETSP0809-20121228/59388_1 /TAXON_ID=73025 ORGANISM="Eutreptiella gymnastica-like, Strain CCMP1594" /NCGR_SAMPLE_ID=MMETSP0809 /ASSEMBLY_ACC=CAM_ASM_000658 /LENGTH=95 /DNA_ID=CAMNT_0015407863 /DNA_START=437 /DNA_END=724 /DNA_ORIENTATION=+
MAWSRGRRMNWWFMGTKVCRPESHCTVSLAPPHTRMRLFAGRCTVRVRALAWHGSHASTACVQAPPPAPGWSPQGRHKQSVCSAEGAMPWGDGRR